MNIISISNGHGEDSISCTLLKQVKSTMECSAIPLIGDGQVYKENKISTLHSNPIFPSGGFIRSLKSLILDIQHGLISNILRQIHIIKHNTKNATHIIAVGDVFCLCMAAFSKKPIFFLPTAKSNTFMPHSWIERQLIRWLAKASYPRDLQTTQAFKKHKLPALYFGNPMMDHLITSSPLLKLSKNKRLLGILPGSRIEAYKNCEYIMKVCTEIHKKNTNIIFACAWPKNLELPILIKQSHWIETKLHNYPALKCPKTQCSIIFTQEFIPLINQAQCIIGLAGTANEQALFLNKPVICFEGFGPQSTLQRFKEQQKLMSKNLIICSKRHIESIAKIALKQLDTNPSNNTLKPSKQHAAQKIMSHIQRTSI